VAIGETEGAKRFAQFGEDGELLPEPVAAEPSLAGLVDQPTVALDAEQPDVAEDAPPV
jgi:hypothetical protein